jgi:hypothetical protein
MRKPAEFETHPVRFVQARAEGLTRGVVKWCQDGDTVGVFVDLGYYQYAVVELRLRADDPEPEIDTPEIVSAERARGLEAKSFTESKSLLCSVVIRPDLTSTDRERKTFERFVGPCWVVSADGTRDDLGSMIRAAGYDKLHPVS